MINIEPVHVGQLAKIGKCKGKDVFKLVTTGGFNLVLLSKGGLQEVIGSGSHPAIAKCIAKKREPEIQWTELSKAEDLPYDTFKHLVPKYEQVTDYLRNNLK